MILIIGVTASGKGRLAFDLARRTGAEIISVDSMKIYRGMDIGTAKPPKEARRTVRYHMIDVVEPSDSFSVAAFLDGALEAIRQIKARNRPVIAVGGTALYIKALLYGLFEGPGCDEQIRAGLREQARTAGLDELYDRLALVDPAAARRIHRNDARRIIRALEVYELTGKPISSFQRQWDKEHAEHEWTIIGLRRDKADQSSRINARARKMVEAGLIDEVASLLAGEKPLSEQARCAIGYAEIIQYLAGNIDLDKAVELIKKNTRRLAKSQRTWFKRFKNVKWLDIGADESDEQVLGRAEALLAEVQG